MACSDVLILVYTNSFTTYFPIIFERRYFGNRSFCYDYLHQYSKYAFDIQYVYILLHSTTQYSNIALPTSQY